jgi:hypothetical protein
MLHHQHRLDKKQVYLVNENYVEKILVIILQHKYEDLLLFPKLFFLWENIVEQHDQHIVYLKSVFHSNFIFKSNKLVESFDPIIAAIDGRSREHVV